MHTVEFFSVESCNSGVKRKNQFFVNIIGTSRNLVSMNGWTGRHSVNMQFFSFKAKKYLNPVCSRWLPELFMKTRDNFDNAV